MPCVHKRLSLNIVAVGVAAVVGAEVGGALIGAMEIATAITAQRWLAEVKNYTDYAPLVSGAVGAIMAGSRIAHHRQGTAAKIAGVSDHAVAGGGAELERTSQIAILDETIGAGGKARPSRKPSAAVIPLPMPAKVSR